MCPVRGGGGGGGRHRYLNSLEQQTEESSFRPGAEWRVALYFSHVTRKTATLRTVGGTSRLVSLLEKNYIFDSFMLVSPDTSAGPSEESLSNTRTPQSFLQFHPPPSWTRMKWFNVTGEVVSDLRASCDVVITQFQAGSTSRCWFWRTGCSWRVHH